MNLHNRSSSNCNSVPRKNLSRNSLDNKNNKNDNRDTLKPKKKIHTHAKSHAILSTNNLSSHNID